MSTATTYRKTYNQKVRAMRNMRTGLMYAVLIVMSIIFLIPFSWMLATSLTEASKIRMSSGMPWIPHPIVWQNYKEALTVLPFHLFLKNTLTITISCIIGQTLSASLVAFGFSRMRFPGRDFLFIMVLATMMLPAQVTMIPSFILFVKLRWIDTLKPLIVPSFFGGGAFFIFLLRQFFLTIPSELEDAAKIDGCSPLGIFRNVALPLSKPALATVAIFSFMGHWNDFMGPLIYTQSMEKKTLALGLFSFKGLHGTEYHLMMAAAIAVLLPVLIIFFSAQKYFVQGIVMSGIKG
jgi:multiple sugar transport system permease protein